MVSKYKYSGKILDEHLKYNERATTLADSPGRSLGSVILKLYSFKNKGYYFSSIWSFKNTIMLPKYKTELLGTF